ncbi:MAG: SMC-Scp complex subunit ScpB [Pirellulaceae bacterium]
MQPTVAAQLHSVCARYARRYPDPVGGTRGVLTTGILAEISTPAARSPSSRLRDDRERRLEAILFVAREPLSTRKLSQYANLADATEARTLIRRLNEEYDQLGRSFRVEEVAGGYQLLTRTKFVGWLRRLDEVPKEMRLSAPALETLAVIAYRQPSGRAEVEAIRGVNCGEILRQLMERDLVRIAGRSEELGRPYLYATTKRFLQLFGLRSLEELPRAVELRKGGPGPSQHEPSHNSATDSPECSEEESQVTATIRSELAPEELKKLRVPQSAMVSPRAKEDDEELDEELEEEDDDLDDDDEDFDDDDDFDDVEDDDLDEDEEEEEDDDFEDEEWEEVEDDEEEEEEDEEWGDEDDEDDDWDDEEEEEEEEEEWD